MLPVQRATPPTATVGVLLLADISGYTRFLRNVEEAHREDVFGGDSVPDAYSFVSSLLDGIIESVVPPFLLSKLEGDAVFAWASDADATPRGAELLAFIGRCYAAFRDQLGRAKEIWTCTCGSCAIVDTLDLKFVLHSGPFVVQSIGGRTELVGPTVVMAHRLLKSGAAAVVGHSAYALVTDAAAQHLDVPTEDAIPLMEAIEHYRPVEAHVYSVPELPV
jgi:class 3 adenylate cyclase